MNLRSATSFVIVALVISLILDIVDWSYPMIVVQNPVTYSVTSYLYLIRFVLMYSALIVFFAAFAKEERGSPKM